MELEQWDLDRREVRREWQYIDILLLDHAHELAVIIENKITPGGDPPSHRLYGPVSYDTVCEVIDTLAEDQRSSESIGLKVALEHYSQMLRRNILEDTDIARLCRKIYQDHKRALDLIYDHRPDPQGAIRDLLIRLINNDGRVRYKHRTGKTYIYFYPTGWSDSPYGPLDFVFHNLPDSLVLFIEVVWEDEEARRRLFEVAQENESPFNEPMEDPGRRLNPKLHRRTFLTRDFYEEASESDRESEIRRCWDEFLEKDMRRIGEVLEGEVWIWET